MSVKTSRKEAAASTVRMRSSAGADDVSLALVSLLLGDAPASSPPLEQAATAEATSATSAPVASSFRRWMRRPGVVAGACARSMGWVCSAFMRFLLGFRR